MGWDDKFMYRVRGVNPYTNRDVWVTNCWHRSLADAQLTLRTLDSRWRNTRIITKNIGAYMREKQKTPRIC